MKLWGGRFQKDTDLLVNELNASISFDQRLYREDITGSMAHAAMLADCGIISKEDAAAITSGLEDILADIEAGKAAFTADNEDIHMNVEALLTARAFFRDIRRRCDEEGYAEILLCPETMGKINQLGDLTEVLFLCTSAERLLPCVDFGHLYARSLGRLDGAEAVEEMLDRMAAELGDRAAVFHSHFSKIEYTPKGGEARHLIFDQPYFGPDPLPLCQAIARRGWTPRVICESAGTQDGDALRMKEAYLAALEAGEKGEKPEENGPK